MRASLGGLFVVLWWLTFARAANVEVDHSDTSQVTYWPPSAWVEVEPEAGVRGTRSFVPLWLVEPGMSLPRALLEISIMAQQPWHQLLVRK
jgi:hypothetical protein